MLNKKPSGAVTSACATHGSEKEMEQSQREEGWSNQSWFSEQLVSCLNSCVEGEQLTAPADVHTSQLCSEDMGAGVSVPGVT